MPGYNEREAQIIERIKKGELRFDPDLLFRHTAWRIRHDFWRRLVLHFLNNRLTQIDLPLQLLNRHPENLTELQRSKLDTIKKHTAEIESFLTELRELGESHTQS